MICEKFVLRPSIWTVKSGGHKKVHAAMESRLEFSWREVAESGMNALSHVFDLKPVLNLAIGIVKISVFGVIEMFLLERTHEALGVSVLGRLARFGHTDLNARIGEARAIASGGVLNTLVRVMELRGRLSQRLFQCGQREGLAQAASQM